ncbi:hypothetical protein [Chitinophaga flava]|uniref:XrtN system VIT domain-containing protein n=1 Tax=Chitinophaga flava TaxID=2259036 RepID=A0A365Y008_9BACT|nr:hypothetical protein [Chitinophaga flava]RBL91658.1 hypothetical protein DF182_03325 [Chitinophaga flava]
MKLGFLDGSSRLYRFGVLVLFAYSIVLIIEQQLSLRGELFCTEVLLYFLGGIWMLTVLFSGNLRSSNPYRRKMVAVVLVMWMIISLIVDKYAGAFATPSPWYAISLFLIGVNTLALSYFRESPQWAREIQAFILGLTILLPVYLTLYLGPLYPICVFAGIIFGIAWAVFSPLFLTWYNWRVLKNTIWQERAGRTAFGAGLGIAVTVIISFCAYYAVVKSRLDDHYHRMAHQEDVQQPGKNKEAKDSLMTQMLAVELSSGFMEKYILKTDFVYTKPLYSSIVSLEDDSGFLMLQRERRHDPLFVTAVFFFGPTTIPQGDREAAVLYLSPKNKNQFSLPQPVRNNHHPQ